MPHRTRPRGRPAPAPRPVAGPHASLAVLAALVAPVVLAAGTPSRAGAQLPADPAVAEAFLAWDRGDYPAALQGWLAALDAPGGEGRVDAIARLTGEIYRTTEITDDGTGVRVGPAGRYATYEVTDGEGVVTRILDLAADARQVASVRGRDAILTADGYVFVIRDGRSEALDRAEADLERARSGADRAAFVRALGRVRSARIEASTLLVQAVGGGEASAVDLGGGGPAAVASVPDTREILVAVSADGATRRIVRVGGDGVVRPVGIFSELAGPPVPVPGGRWMLIEGAAPGAGPTITLVDTGTGRAESWPGADPTVSRDGRTVAWLRPTEEGREIVSARLGETGAGAPRVVWRGGAEATGLVLSPSGRRVAWQARPFDDWEIFVAPSDGGGEALQVTDEIQHDQFPVFLDESTVLAAKGEGRHRRAFLYDLETGAVTRLHHNNTLRTIAPEYAWAPTPDGSAVFVVAERDGDTVSPERGLYRVDRTARVGMAELRARLERNLAAELDLRERGRRAFAPIADEVRLVTERVDVGRIYQHARVLYEMGSKYITMPGNRMASEHIARTLRGWGYEPELQWFEPRPGIRTANVIVRVPGTRDPELVYVASSHYDSVERGPGADDDSSGTTALLEVARVLRDHPMPATIELAFFTGEEAGLLGSREYVRRAVADGKRIVGALNNDMIGWANGHRLDNTIRYSNPGIRDVQHAAAMDFGGLITYDALYYKNTDAHAYYEQYGDIVGGIGSYPVLGNPHYHQATDRLETIDQRLVAAVSRTTVATLMLLASSPSRLDGLTARATGGGGVEVAWTPAPESDVVGYEVAWTDAGGAPRLDRVDGPSARLEGVLPGTEVRVRAVDRSGLLGWDWRRAVPSP